jgi:hypothetical protein
MPWKLGRFYGGCANTLLEDAFTSLRTTSNGNIVIMFSLALRRVQNVVENGHNEPAENGNLRSDRIKNLNRTEESRARKMVYQGATHNLLCYRLLAPAVSFSQCFRQIGLHLEPNTSEIDYRDLRPLNSCLKVEFTLLRHSGIEIWECGTALLVVIKAVSRNNNNYSEDK